MAEKPKIPSWRRCQDNKARHSAEKHLKNPKGAQL
nr:MAG TPA: hypothetical protein [Caudoviricetes sp.]